MTTQISLRAINNSSDLSCLYTLMCGDDQYLYSVKMHHKSEGLFFQWLNGKLNNEFHDFYLICIDSIDSPIGFVHDYDFDLKNGHCKTVVYISQTYRNTGIGSFAALTFLKKLFQNYPIRKVYSTVYSFNSSSLENHKRAGFMLEGCLNDYKYWNGKYYPMFYLSITRDVFLAKIMEWDFI